LWRSPFGRVSRGGWALAIAALPQKCSDSDMHRSIPITHKKTFDINAMAMVVKTTCGTWTTGRRHTDVKIFFLIFFARFS
jgi:hypothetical protein